MRKILCAALALCCVWFATPSFANCNLFDGYNSAAVTLDETNNVLSNKVRDTRTSFQLQVQMQKTDNSYVIPINQANIATGKQTFTFNVPEDIKYFAIKHNGVTQDIKITPDTLLPSAGTYTLSFDVLSNDPTTVGGLQLQNIKLERGTTATAYTPYDAECIERCKNLFDGELAIGGLLFANGDVTNETQYLYSIRSIPVIPNTSYVLSADTSKIKKGEVYFYKNNGEYNGHISDALKNLPIAFTTPEDTYQVKFILMGSGENLQPSDATNVQLEQGSTATAYVPYHPGCHETNIKIASTKYAETVFNPLNTALANAVATVNTVVTNTINQAASIATLQSGKQTRPNETCPAGKKCLLVEGTDGQPHWYEICSSAHCLPDGYTELEYIQSTGAQEIDTGLPLLGTDTVKLKYSHFIRSNNASRMLFGNYFSTYRFAVNFYGSETTNGLFYWGNENQVGFNTPPTNDDLSHVVKFENAKIYIDNDIVVSTHLLTNDFNTGVNMFIFSAGAQSFRSAYRLYYYQHAKADGQMVRDLVPAKRNSDGAIGLYDLVDKQFYTNTGFIDGPVAE